MEENPLKSMFFLIAMTLCLLAFSASAEIYKYVDDQGNVYYTDDLNQVPPDQRKAMEATQEYESDTDTEQGGTQAESKQAAESEQTAESQQEEEIDPELQSSYPDESTETAAKENPNEAAQDVQEGESQVVSDISDDDTADLEATRKRLETMKKEIDNEYREILDAKKKLAKEKETLVNREDILKYNLKVEELNKRAEAYMQKGKQYKEQVEAYNERVTQKNAEIQQKKDKE